MKLYFKFFAMHLKSRMAYKKSFFLSILGQFLTSFTAFLTIAFLFDRFESVKGYTFGECMLCAGVVWLSFSLAECFFRGLDTFGTIVRTGQFDKVLVRPRSPMFQVLCEKIELTRVGKMAQGCIMLGLGIARAPVVWTPGRVMVLIGMVLGGTVVFASLFMVYAALCFFTMEGLEFFNVFTDGAREYAAYPLDVFGEKMLKITTYFIPYALFQYYPLMVLLGRTDQWAYGLLPLLTPLFAIPCFALWKVGIRKYKSSGS